MKTKWMLAAALVGAATLSAQAGVHFGFSFGVPLPVPVVAPVVPVAPVVVAPPVVVAAAPCPGVGYIWAPGYWSVCAGSRVWVPGCWRYGGGPRGGYAYGYGHGGWEHSRGWRR